jgi:hypothetical protein
MLLYYCGYYLLDVSFGAIWWTSSKLFNGAVYVYNSAYAIEDKKEDDEFVILEHEDLKKEIMELKALIKATTRELHP